VSTTRARSPARQPILDRPRPPLAADLAVAGIVGAAVLLAAAAGIHRSPVSPPLIAGAGAAGPFRALAAGLGIDGLTRDGGAALAYVVMALFVGAFLLGLREAWRGHISLRTVLWLSVAFELLAGVLPLLLSRDAYSYAIYGRIDAVYHHNPYVVTPVHFPNDQLSPFVGPVWRDTPVVYGPAFSVLSGLLARMISSPTGLVWGFKAVAGFAGIGTLFLIASSAKRLAPRRAAFAVAAFGWNPAVVAFTTGGGHNDMLVALCVAGAFAVLVRGGTFDRLRGGDGPGSGRWPRHELMAVAILTLGALVKASVGPALVLLVVASAAARPRGARWRVVAAEAAIVVGLTVAFAAPYWQTSNPTLGLAELAKHREWLSASRLLMAVFGGIGDNLWGAGGRTAVEAVIRSLMAATAVAGVVLVAIALARRVRGMVAGRGATTAVGAAWGWALLVTVLASPVVFPWYVAWILPVAFLLPRAGRGAVIGLAVVLSLTRALAEPQLLPGWYRVLLAIGHDVIGPVFLVFLMWAVVRVVRIGRGRSPLDDPDLVGSGRPAAVAVPAGAPSRGEQAEAGDED
jgi:hypothetical protein